MLRLMPHPLQFAFQSAGPLPARSLSCRLCRDASSPLPPSSDVGKFIRGAAFPTARAGLRRPQMRSAALFRPSDGFSARPGNVAAPCGGVHSGSGNEPPVRSLSGRLCRDASSSLPPSPDVGKFIRGHRLSDRPCGIAVSADAPRGPLSPVRRIFGTPRHVAAPCGGGGHSGSGNEPPAPHSPGGQTPPGAAAATVQLSGSPLPVPMRPVRPKREVRTGAARRFRPNHAVRPPLADVRLFGNGSARNIEGLSNKSRKSEITPVGIHSGRGKIVEIRLVRQLQFAHT